MLSQPVDADQKIQLSSSENEDFGFEQISARGENASKPSGSSHTNEYDCVATGQSFECSKPVVVDYNALQTIDAKVSLALRYTGTFAGADKMTGIAALNFTCEGSKCADVASQWTVAQFPCTVSADFAGVATAAK